MAANASKDKGNRGEILVRDALRKATGLKWEKTPLSGALNPVHGLGSDLYVPNSMNIYSVEVKNYMESHVGPELITSKSPILKGWWDQVTKSAKDTNKLPLLIFRHNRSKLFVCFQGMLEGDSNHMYLIRDDMPEVCICLLEDWITHNEPKFIK